MPCRHILCLLTPLLLFLTLVEVAQRLWLLPSLVAVAKLSWRRVLLADLPLSLCQANTIPFVIKRQDR